MKRKKYYTMSANEIEAGAKKEAWEKACQSGRQYLILGKTPYIVLENQNNIPFAFKVLTVEGDVGLSFPFRIPNRPKG